MTDWTCSGWMCWSLVGLLVTLVVALVCGWLSGLHPLFEVVTNVRAQLVPFAVVAVVGLIALRQWNLAVIALTVFGVVVSSMGPYWSATADPLPAKGQTLAVMQYNIFFGNDAYQAMADHIVGSDADVVALHELLPHQWDGLAPLLDDYPYRIAVPLAEVDGQPGGGMALLSRTPLDRVQVDDEMSPVDRVTIAATTMLDGEQVLVIGLHPHASRHESAKVSLRHVQFGGVADMVNASQLPAIVLTDMNVAPTSPLYQDFLESTGWRDPHAVVGWQSSWPSWSGPLGMPIDHVFVSNDIALHRYVTGHGAGSDHKSVTATISLTP